VSWYGDPDDLDRLAQRLARAGEDVRVRAVTVRVRVGRAGWSGRAADAFHAAVRQECHLLEQAAGELEHAAAALHRHAATVRAELARLRALERATEHLVSNGIAAAEHAVTRLLP